MIDTASIPHPVTDAALGSILVVEDDPTQRLLVTQVAAGSGRTVLQAADADTALSLIDDPDGPTLSLLVLDLELGKRSGFDVLDAVRAHNRHATVPIVVLTGHDAVDARVRGLTAGANDYVGKPVSPRELEARITAHLSAATSWQTILDDDLQLRRVLAADIMKAGATLHGRHLWQAVTTAVANLPGARHVDIVDVTDPETVHRGLTSRPAGRLLARLTPTQLTRRISDGPSLVRRDEGTVALVPFDTSGSRRGLLIVEPDRADAPSGQRLLASVIDAASILASGIGGRLLEGDSADAAHSRIEQLVRTRAFHPVFQPIVDLDADHVVGYEALTRFDDMPPDVAFAEAAAVGLSHALHRVTTHAIGRAARSLPADAYVAINAAADVVTAPGFGSWLPRGRRVVVEITEHEPVADYARLVAEVRDLGPHVGLAADDAGAGYASLHHILSLDPAIVKLDRSLVTGIHRSPSQEAMVAGLVHFADRRGIRLIAEGIEERAEAEVVRDLGVHDGQGWYFGRPAPATSL